MPSWGAILIFAAGTLAGLSFLLGTALHISNDENGMDRGITLFLGYNEMAWKQAGVVKHATFWAFNVASILATVLFLVGIFMVVRGNKGAAVEEDPSPSEE